MTYTVTQYCVDCRYTDCAEVCPVEAFHIGPRMLYINPETCIDCDACVPACPVAAIFPEDEVPEKWQHFTQINADECENYDTIAEKIDQLPTAKPLEELEALEAEGKLPTYP
jgi:ferredoxin